MLLPTTKIVHLTHLLIISYKKVKTTPLNLISTGIHKQIHHKKYNYIDRLILNPYRAFKFKGNKETNLKIYLTLKNIENKYLLIGEEDFLISNDNIRNNKNTFNECECNHREFYKSIPKINCKFKQPFFTFKKTSKRQKVIINLIEYNKQYWKSLYKKDPITCHNLGLFLGFNYVYHCNINPYSLVVAMNIHNDLCN